MPDLRSVAVVLVVAAGTGVVLARRASAVVVGQPLTADGSQASGPAPLLAMPASSRDDEEHVDREGPAGSPYDEPAPPLHQALARSVVPAQAGMLRLPGGRFVMGSASARAPSNERPAHVTVVAPFWIDRTEVTVGAYRACVDAGSCAAPARASATCTFDAGDAELPISCVYWRDADAYCRFSGKRLPSEIEWEYAARGTYAIPYPWGNTAACANAVTLVNEQSGKSCAPHPAHVGSHPGGASVFGVLDMSGNVEEWTADWYAELLGPSPHAGAAHVLRGGGWLSPPSQSRTTSRDWGSALEAGPNVGMRCARDGD